MSEHLGQANDLIACFTGRGTTSLFKKNLISTHLETCKNAYSSSL